VLCYMEDRVSLLYYGMYHAIECWEDDYHTYIVSLLAKHC